MFSAIREVLLQESPPEVGPSHLLLLGLHLLLHPHPPVLCLGHQQKGGEGEFLRLGALYHPEYFLAFSKPCVCLVWSGFPSELRWLMAHKVFHRHRSDKWNHGSWLHYHRLHRIYHLVDCIRNLISPSGIPTSFVCHCLCTPHSSAVNIEQLKIITGSITF